MEVGDTLLLGRASAVQTAIAAVLDGVSSHIWEESLWESLCVIPVRSCLDDMLEALNAAHLSRDCVARDVLCEPSWLADWEAPPCQADTWIRGAVPRRPARLSATPPEALRNSKHPGGKLRTSPSFLYIWKTNPPNRRGTEENIKNTAAVQTTDSFRRLCGLIGHWSSGPSLRLRQPKQGPNQWGLFPGVSIFTTFAA